MVRKIHDPFNAVNAGLTLLEVIVATSLVMLLTGGVVAGYATFNSNQRVKQTILTLKNDLHAAAARSSAGLKPASGCTTLDGYTVTLTSSGYTIQAQCDGVLVNDSVIKTVTTLPSDISITTSPVTAAFTFNVLSRGTTLSGAMTITVATTNKSYSIIVSPNGDIN